MSRRATSTPAATTTAPAESVEPSARTTPVTRSPSTCRPVDTRVARLDAGAQRGDELARVDGVVGLDLQREPDGRRERGLQLAGLRRAQPLDGQAEPAAELGEAVERLGLVAVARDDERADGAVAGIVQLLAERRVAPRALQPEFEQRALAERRFGDRAEHPRGNVPRAGLAGVQDDHPRAALLGAERAGKADRTAADHGDVEAL